MCIVFFQTKYYCTFNRWQYSVKINLTCVGKPNICVTCFIAAIWNHTQSTSKVWLHIIYLRNNHQIFGASLVAQLVKNLPAIQEMQKLQVWFLGWEDPLGEGMTSQSSILTWRIPWTERLGGGYSPQGRKEVDPNQASEHAHMHQILAMGDTRRGLS